MYFDKRKKFIQKNKLINCLELASLDESNGITLVASPPQNKLFAKTGQRVTINKNNLL